MEGTVSFTVDYKKMKSAAEEIEKKLDDITRLLNGIYDKVKDMHKFWQGKNYAELVKKFNNLREPVINATLKQLCKVLNKIKRIERIYECSMNGLGDNDINLIKFEEKVNIELPVPEETTKIVFQENEVNGLRGEIKTDFERVGEIIATIEEPISSVTWER